MKQLFFILLIFSSIMSFAFDGEIKLSYTYFNGGDFKVEEVSWLFKKDQAKMTMNMRDANGKLLVTSFIPEKNSKALTIYSNTPSSDGKNQYFQVDISKIEDLKKAEYRTEKTTETKTILGYACEKYMVYSQSTITEMWVAKSIDIPYGSYASYFKTNAEIQGMALTGINGFPLESTTKSLAGNIIFQYMAQSVSGKSVDANQFNVPAGYTLTTTGH
jgi:hypothetical protein